MRQTRLLGIAIVGVVAACSEPPAPNQAMGSGGSSGGPGTSSSGGALTASGGVGTASGGAATVSGGTSGASGNPGQGGASAGAGGTSGGAATSGGTAGMASGGTETGGGGGSAGEGTGGALAGAGGAAGSGGSDGDGGTPSGGSGGSNDGGASTGGTGGTMARCDPELSQQNRMLASKAIDELFIDKDITAVDRYWSDPYLQHNPIAMSGVSTFRNLFSGILNTFTYQRLLTLAECDLAVVLGRYSQNGVIFDMFRIQEGKLMEHWDSDANQASSMDGLDPLDTSAPGADNRELFLTFADEVLIAGDWDRAAEFLGAAFEEHHGSGGTGPAAFTAYIDGESVTYTKVHHVIADGDYVFALSEGKRGAQAFGFYDLFRVEDGKIVEHWDSRRSVPNSTQSGLGIF